MSRTPADRYATTTSPQSVEVDRLRRMYANGSLADYCSWILTEVAMGRRKPARVRTTEREVVALLESLMEVA